MFPPTCSFSGTMYINLIFKGFKTRFETEAHGFLNPGPQSHRPGAVPDYNQPRIKDYSPLHIFLLITRLHFKHFFIRLEQSSDRERKSNTTVFTMLYQTHTAPIWRENKKSAFLREAPDIFNTLKIGYFTEISVNVCFTGQHNRTNENCSLR